MASRYGRKKRRQARQRVEQLESALEVLAYRNDRLTRLELLVEQWDDEMRRILGRFSALRVNAPTELVDDIDTAPRRRATYSPASGPVTRGRMAAYGLETTAIATMRQLRVAVRCDHHLFKTLIRLRLVDTKHVTAFDLSDDLLAARGISDRDVEWVTREIADQLCALMNRGLEAPE